METYVFAAASGALGAVALALWMKMNRINSQNEEFMDVRTERGKKIFSDVV